MNDEAGAVGTRINGPLSWWRTHLPLSARLFLTWLWPWLLPVFFLLSAIDLTAAIFGGDPGLMSVLPPLISGTLFLAIISGFARDIRDPRDIFAKYKYGEA